MKKYRLSIGSGITVAVCFLVYIFLWLVKGQPMFMIIDNKLKYTYKTGVEWFDDENYDQKDIENFSRMEWISDFHGTFRHTDNLNVVKQMKNLKKIGVSVYAPNKIVDWSGIPEGNMELMFISGGELESFNSFPKLNSLKYLTIEHGVKGARLDMSDIDKFPSLENLELDNYAVYNCENIRKLKNLKSLSMSNNAMDILPYLPTDALTQLVIASVDRTEMDYTNLLRLTNLEELYLARIHIEDIESLIELENLKLVTVYDMYSNSDLEKLRNSGIEVSVMKENISE